MPPKKPTTTKAPAKTPAKPAAKTGAKPAAKKTDSKTEAKGAAAAPVAPPPAPEFTTVGFKGLGKLVEEGQTGTIRETKKWALIVDLQGNVSTFLKYRNANYMQPTLPGEMSPDKVRQALLGALRFGKPLVMDVEEGNINVIQAIEDVEKDLLKSLLDHSILENEKYLSLARDSDEKEYHNSAYYKLEGFCFIVVTTNPDPDHAMAANFTCYKVE